MTLVDLTTSQIVHAGEAERFGGWHWRAGIRGEHFRRCSYCGSVHPDDLAAEPCWYAQWADQKYGWPHKFYVDMPNRDPDRLFVIGSRSGGQKDAPLDGPDWVYWEKMSRAQRKIWKADGPHPKDWHPNAVLFGKRPSHFGKFYTVHLQDPEISDETKEIIARISGRRFTFTLDGHVSWQGI
jgi:hypothetical protein